MFNGKCQQNLVSYSNFYAFLDHFSFDGDVMAPSYHAAGANVPQLKEAPMLVALVTKSKVDAGTVW